MVTMDPGVRERGVLPDRTGTLATATAESPSAVSWGAIFAGAAGAAALSLILLILGVGLGMSAVSPWSHDGLGARAFGLSTVAWLTFTQIAASGMGGYLAGRLRTKWAAVHTDEVYFRDTAHGFLAWAVASLVTAATLGSAIGGIVSSTAQAGATMAGGAAATVATAGGAAIGGSQGSGGADPTAYYVDALMRRSSTPAPAADAASGAAPAAATSSAPTADTGGASTAEIGRIFSNALKSGTLPADDARYLGQLVAQRTGASQADAEKRVTDTFGRLQTGLRDAETQARDAADKARKATAYASLWLFVTLLIGAFAASWAATLGGRRRDF